MRQDCLNMQEGLVRLPKLGEDLSIACTVSSFGQTAQMLGAARGISSRDGKMVSNKPADDPTGYGKEPVWSTIWHLALGSTPEPSTVNRTSVGLLSENSRHWHSIAGAVRGPWSIGARSNEHEPSSGQARAFVPMPLCSQGLLQRSSASLAKPGSGVAAVDCGHHKAAQN